MCGLVGAAGNITPAVKDTFTELLLIDVVRGQHSTGVAAVKRSNNDIALHKAPIPSPIFIGTQEYADWLAAANSKLLLGHNRYATVGEKTVANAHPFKFPQLVGAHNGTLDKWALNQLPDKDKYGTDSEALYSCIAENGLKETIQEMSGAWALTFFDVKANTMNLLRNKERPLFYAYTEDRKTMFWASEDDMLVWVADRHNIKLFGDGVFECEEDMHYRWSVPSKPGDAFEKPVVAKIIGYDYKNWKERHAHKAPSGTTTAGSGQAYGATNPTYSAATVVSSKPVIPIQKKPRERVDTTKFRHPYKDAYGRILNRKKFEEQTARGCVFCEEKNAVFGKFILPLKDDLDGRKLYLCEDCYNDDDILDLVDQVL